VARVADLHNDAAGLGLEARRDVDAPRPSSASRALFKRLSTTCLSITVSARTRSGASGADTVICFPLLAAGRGDERHGSGDDLTYIGRFQSRLLFT